MLSVAYEYLFVLVISQHYNDFLQVQNVAAEAGLFNFFLDISVLISLSYGFFYCAVVIPD